MSPRARNIPTLAALIRDHQDRTGDSYGDIARKTGLSKAKIGQLAQQDQTYLVRQETLAKLSAGLHIALATVKRAALGTAGFTDRDAQTATKAQEIAERLDELDDATLDLIRDLVEVVATHRP